MSQLNLEEGKRLLSEPYDRVIECPSTWHDTGHSYRSTCPECGVSAFSRRGKVRERTFAEKHAAKWLRDNTAALIAAAEEAEKLRELLREARECVHLHRGRRLEWLPHDNRSLSERIDAALAPPETQETP